MAVSEDMSIYLFAEKEDKKASQSSSDLKTCDILFCVIRLMGFFVKR
jgi:hypothetical protein